MSAPIASKEVKVSLKRKADDIADDVFFTRVHVPEVGLVPLVQGHVSSLQDAMGSAGADELSKPAGIRDAVHKLHDRALVWKVGSKGQSLAYFMKVLHQKDGAIDQMSIPFRSMAAVWGEWCEARYFKTEGSTFVLTPLGRLVQKNLYIRTPKVDKGWLEKPHYPGLHLLPCIVCAILAQVVKVNVRRPAHKIYEGVNIPEFHEFAKKNLKHVLKPAFPTVTQEPDESEANYEAMSPQALPDPETSSTDDEADAHDASLLQETEAQVDMEESVETAESVSVAIETPTPPSAPPEGLDRAPARPNRTVGVVRIAPRKIKF